ncbi:hypothetical protein Bca52824_067226 [Brassica carinata]|uniref:Uncharacterized protein n=1 Tax=Brassica carinata TaxID=52824 RepID=A0A8X7UCN3_BRACI|nr:hypothetical protein Bca52824_067226 [Brassica carinata]
MWSEELWMRIASHLGTLVSLRFLIFLIPYGINCLVCELCLLVSYYAVSFLNCHFIFLALFRFVRFDYLWAKAVLLTTTTVASARLTIQVPLAAIVDSLSENKPSLTDFIGAAAVMVGFAGINIPAEMFHGSKEISIELQPGTSFTNSPQVVSDIA